MSFWSCLSSGIGSVCSAICDAVSHVGKMCVSIATKLVESKVLEPIMAIVDFLAKVLVVIEKQESPEELGDKAMRADKKLEEFDSTNDYINYLRKEVKFDKAEFDKCSDIDKTVRAAIGSTICTLGIEEKLNMLIPPEFLKKSAELKMHGEEVKNYLDSFKKIGLSDMTDMCDYLERKADPKNVEKIGAAILDGLARNNPTLNEEQLNEKIAAMQQSVLSPKE